MCCVYVKTKMKTGKIDRRLILDIKGCPSVGKELNADLRLPIHVLGSGKGSSN